MPDFDPDAARDLARRILPADPDDDAAKALTALVQQIADSKDALDRELLVHAVASEAYIHTIAFEDAVEKFTQRNKPTGDTQ